MTIKIRSMTPDDKPVVMSLLQTLPEFKPSEVIVAEEVINAYLADPSGSGYRIRVAEADSVIAGYVCLGPAPMTEGTWDIYWIAVATGKQRQGIGSALITSAQDDIKRAQGRLVVVETSSQPEYEKTRRFYLSQGYQVACRIPDFYAPGDDKLILTKELR
jgi:ribosomal protein S18 acetylase RimI-like enzyme